MGWSPICLRPCRSWKRRFDATRPALESSQPNGGKRDDGLLEAFICDGVRTPLLHFGMDFAAPALNADSSAIEG